MDKIIRKQIINSYHCDTVDYLNVSTSHEKVTFKYVMLPVYIGNFTFKQKLYNFFINGTNGKVKGKAPVSFWRVFFTVLLGIAVVVGGVLAYFLTK